MRSEWPTVRLGDHIESCLGKMLDAKKNKGAYQSYLGNSNVRWGAFDLTELAEMKFEADEEARYSLEPGDLVVCEGGEPGRCAIWTGEKGMKIQKALHRIRPKTTLDNYYLFYWFLYSSKLGLLEPYFTGTTIKHLTGKALSALELPLPPLSMQRAAVAVLKLLDDRITLLRETNKTIESIAQAIFKSWFVDFDPVRAKMEGRQPEGMDEETAALFPNSFEESRLGLIPTHWSARSFHEMIRIIGGGTPKTSNPDYWGGHIPWYSVGDVPSGADTFVVNTEKKITQAGLDGSSTKLLPFGTTIISARGTVGKLALTGCEMAMNQSCYGLRGQNNDIFFTYFSTQRLVEHLKQKAHGSVFDTITTATFKGVIAASPPPSIIARFETNVEVLMERVLVNLKTLTSLAQLRDSLLPRLISGQLRLPEAQKQVEKALQ